jgi:hypothetical protein
MSEYDGFEKPIAVRFIGYILIAYAGLTRNAQEKMPKIIEISAFF